LGKCGTCSLDSSREAGDDNRRAGAVKEQLELAPSVGYLNASLLKFGKLVGGYHNATNRTILASPWNDRPAQPLNLAILTRKDVAIRCDDRSGEAALMYVLPSLRNLREDVIVRATDDLVPVESYSWHHAMLTAR